MLSIYTVYVCDAVSPGVYRVWNAMGTRELHAVFCRDTAGEAIFVVSSRKMVKYPLSEPKVCAVEDTMIKSGDVAVLAASVTVNPVETNEVEDVVTDEVSVPCAVFGVEEPPPPTAAQVVPLFAYSAFAVLFQRIFPIRLGVTAAI
jgi:hypothetical protein